MEKRIGQKLGSLFGLMLFGFVLFLGFYHFSQRFASEYSLHTPQLTKDRPRAFHNEVLPARTVKDRRYDFQRDQARSIGKIKLTYRGREGRSICLIDVVIPELDPQRPYKYRLDIDTAEKGFRMAGYQFKLVSIGKNYIRLIRETP